MSSMYRSAGRLSLPPFLGLLTLAALAVGQSIRVPRSLVSATPRLGRVVLERTSVLLVRMDDTAERRELLKKTDKTDKFEALTPENLSSVAALRQLMLLIR